MLDLAISQVMPAVLEKWEHEVVAGQATVKLHLKKKNSPRKLVLVVSDPTEALSFTSNFDPFTGCISEGKEQIQHSTGGPKRRKGHGRKDKKAARKRS